jgi:hypothetical protein
LGAVQYDRKCHCEPFFGEANLIAANLIAANLIAAISLSCLLNTALGFDTLRTQPADALEILAMTP